MVNREELQNTTPARAEMVKNLHEADKAFDESMESLMAWLNKAQSGGYLSNDDALKIFNEELKARRDYEYTDKE